MSAKRVELRAKLDLIVCKGDDHVVDIHSFLNDPNHLQKLNNNPTYQIWSCAEWVCGRQGVKNRCHEFERVVEAALSPGIGVFNGRRYGYENFDDSTYQEAIDWFSTLL